MHQPQIINVLCIESIDEFEKDKIYEFLLYDNGNLVKMVAVLYNNNFNSGNIIVYEYENIIKYFIEIDEIKIDKNLHDLLFKS